MKSAVLPLAALAVMLGGLGSARADLITNGSFENPVLSNGEALLVNAGDSTTIPGWTVVGSPGVNIAIAQTNYTEYAGNGTNNLNNGMMQFNAEDGLNSIDVTGASNQGPTAGLQQTVAITPGDSYLLSFWVGRAQSNNGAFQYQDPSTVDLSINGGPKSSFTNSDTPNPGFVVWHEFSTSFTASNSSTTIAFLNGTPSNTFYAGLDNVSLVEQGAATAPEPASLTLMGIGMAIMSGCALRRKHRPA